MAKTKKKAECVLTDADKFPIESCRERIARRFGLDAVALSGPCEGERLAKCVCDQLQARWDRIKERYAKKTDKVQRLALKMAESWAKDEDDTKECVADLLKKYDIKKEAAVGIAQYLKASLIDNAVDFEIKTAMDELDMEDEAEGELDFLSLDDGEEDLGEDTDLGEDVEIDIDLGEEDEEESPELSDEGLDLEPEGMKEEEGELEPAGEGMVSIDLPISVVEELVNAIEGEEHMLANVDDDPAIEVLEEEEGPETAPDEIVPGEPANMSDEGFQFVETESAENQCACVSGEGMQDEEALMAAKKEKQVKEAAMQLRGGRLRRIGQNVLKIGPEMSINNTDQQAGGHDLGKAKDKAVEDPKALDDGNVHNEAYTANDNKFSDGKTMGHEQKFDPHKVTKDEVSGGDSSLMGKDESYPEGKPDVPAGSAPIGGEQWDGGDVSTKGTVIATLTPQGIRIDRKGQKPLLAKVAIDSVSDDMIKAISELKFDGDVKKFAREAVSIVKKAKTECKDGVTYTDTSALEGKKFTNDAEKKPEDGGAKVKSGGDNSNKDCTKTDTSKLEADKFTNDAEKKPEEDKKASSGKSVKTAADKEKVVGPHAGDKKVEDPKPLDKSNIKPEGFMAGGKDVHAPDGSVMGQETKFEAHEVEKSEVSKGEASLMGKDESLPKDGPAVPAGGGQMQQEELEGGDVSTKGTVIAENDRSQKCESSEIEMLRNEQKVKEARMKAASVLAADMLQHGEISKDEYTKTFETLAGLPVPAIQTLAVSVKKHREKVEAKNRTVEAQRTVPVLSRPIVYDATKEEPSLTQKISELWSSNKVFDPDNYDERGRKKFN